jgi:hypothetical protein
VLRKVQGSLYVAIVAKKGIIGEDVLMLLPDKLVYKFGGYTSKKSLVGGYAGMKTL